MLGAQLLEGDRGVEAEEVGVVLDHLGGRRSARQQGQLIVLHGLEVRHADLQLVLDLHQGQVAVQALGAHALAQPDLARLEGRSGPSGARAVGRLGLGGRSAQQGHLLGLAHEDPLVGGRAARVLALGGPMGVESVGHAELGRGGRALGAGRLDGGRRAGGCERRRQGRRYGRGALGHPQPDPGEQLGRAVGLGDMVDGALLEGPHHILLVRRAAQHDHRGLGRQAAQQLPAAAVARAHLEDDQSGALLGV